MHGSTHAAGRGRDSAADSGKMAICTGVLASLSGRTDAHGGLP